MENLWPITNLYLGHANLGDVSRRLREDFDGVAHSGKYELYRRKIDATCWRLEREELAHRFFVRIDNVDCWATFDATQIERDLIVEDMGVSTQACIQHKCKARALNGSACCVDHFHEGVVGSALQREHCRSGTLERRR